MEGKGMLNSGARGRAQSSGRTAGQAAQAAIVNPAAQRQTQQVSLLRLTALRLVYQAIRRVEDAELCEAGLSK